MTDIILDIDSVGDDILAVIYAALSDKLNVLGITTVNGACGSIEQATWVALNTVALTGCDIPVYAGADKMLCPRELKMHGDPVNFDEALRHKFGDRLDSFNEKAQKPAKNAERESAADYIVRAVNERPGEITLVTTGPLTNVALALRRDPTIAAKIKQAFVLGGAFHIAANITPVAEYNIWADPEAAKEVLSSEMKITLVPLDVCENNAFADGMLTRDHLADLEQGGGAISRYVIEKFPIYIDLWREFFQLGGFPMDDVITVALAGDESLCAYTENVFVDVETEGQLARGQTVAYFGKQIMAVPRAERKNTRIASSLEGKRFMNLFVDTLLGK